MTTKTLTEMQEWLLLPTHQKCVLVEIEQVSVSGSPQTFYFSTAPYYDTVDGKEYLPIISEGITFSESLSADASISISSGSLNLINTGGAYDSYIDYTWRRRSIKIYFGDVTWSKSSFPLIFTGLVEDLRPSSENILTITLVDKLQQLNDVLSKKTLRDLSPDLNAPIYSESVTDVNSQILVPLLFGEAFNVQPLFVDNGTGSVASNNNGLLYKYHDGTTQGVIEVRDDGIPVEFVSHETRGEFELISPPAGTITCSVRKDTFVSGGTNNCTVPKLITDIVKNYGIITDNRFVDADIDFTGITNSSTVGLYCKESINILEACNQLAKSINAGLVWSPVTVNHSTKAITAGKLKLIELKDPSSATSLYDLTDDYIVQGTLQIETFTVKPNIKLGYCKNYTLQQTVAPALNPEANFSDEYWYINLSNNTTIQREIGTVDAEATLLLTTSDATTEAQKRLDLWGVQRYLIRATYLPHLIFSQLGDIVTVKSTRFGLINGKKGFVFSTSRNWTTGFIEIGVLV